MAISPNNVHENFQPKLPINRSLPSSAPTVLVLDDDTVSLQRVELICKSARERFQIISVSTTEEAEGVLNTKKIHAMLLDRDLGRDPAEKMINGIDFIPDFLNIQPHLQILVLTGNDEISEVVRAINSGALNFIVKDAADDLILAQVERAIGQARVKLREMQFEATSKKSEDKFTGKSRVFRALKQRLMAMAEPDQPILLLGESGTGKTTAAKFIHEIRSKARGQKDAPFCGINMATIPAALADRELFGNERGAYTDAREARAGIIELVDGGTLFLDEIGETSIETQAKLLKVLEDGTYMRLGSNRERKSSFKLICATNRDLDEMVAKGSFREDLYMRVSAFTEKVPSLLERADDIPDIIKALLPKISASLNVDVRYEDLPAEFIDSLQSTPIPGNIRGLNHSLVRLLTFSAKGQNGRPILSAWKRLLFPKIRDPKKMGPTDIKIPFDASVPNFEGLKGLTEKFEDAIMLHMSKQFMRNDDIAKALKVSPATSHRLLKRIGHSSRFKIVQLGHYSPVVKVGSRE